jgi:hypothetical protein
MFLLFQITSVRADHTGHINKIFTSLPNNYSFRVFFDTEMSGCNSEFSYVNTSDPNYQVYVSTLLLAYSTGKSVTVITVLDSGGYCRINELSVQ